MRIPAPRSLLPVLSLLLAVLFTPGPAVAGKPYGYAVVGNPANAVHPAGYGRPDR